MTDWTEKYRPSTLSEVRGNDKARDALEEWARTWDDHREAVIVHGSPGIGKTSAAHALAADLGWEAIELNASDDRTEDAIRRVAGRAANNESLKAAVNRAREESGDGGGAGDDIDRGRGNGRQLVILDEADNIHYQKDYGGQQALVDVIKSASQPIVLIANDLYDMSRGLRNAGQQIEFRDVSARSIRPVLRDISRRENVEYEDAALEAIAEQNSGDLRGAINDLQALAEDDRELTVEDVVTSDRDRTADIWTFLDSVLKESSAQDALHTAYDSDETPDNLVQWVEDKVPKVYDSDELATAYEFLAKADTWLGRVRATQNYSYWRYATDNVSAGVAASRNRTRGGWTRYGGPPFRSKSNQTRDEIARAIAEESGVSMSTARREIMPFLATMTHHCRNRELTVAMAAVYDLDAKEVSFVTGSGEDTNKVQEIVEDARELREERLVEGSGGAFEGSIPSVSEASEDDGRTDEPEGEDSGDRAEDAESQSGLTDFT